MNSKIQKILVFSGPSGGHLFPAQAFAEELREKFPEIQIVLVTSIRAEGLCQKFPDDLFSEIIYLPEFGSPGFSPSRIKSILRIPQAIIESWNLISRIHPSLCIGFGSFVSYFGVLFAAWRGIPTLIHEQNQVPGKATRMLQNVVKHIAVSFPKTAFRRAPQNVVVTGLPIRRNLRERMIMLEQKPAHPFTVLICGGSQGSVFLNQAVLKAFSLLFAEERAGFAVIHITGMGQEAKLIKAYAELAINAEVYTFLEQMQLVYNRAHMAISRAGANSAFEQALYGIPTVFIPYPHAEGHQNENARYFVESGGAVMYPQNEQSSEMIVNILRQWSKRPKNYWETSHQLLTHAQNQGHAYFLEVVLKMLNLKS